MPSVATASAAPAVGAAAERLAALRATMARFEAPLLPRPTPAPAPVPVDTTRVPAYAALARAQAAKFDADRAFWEVRDHYWGPDRKARKQAARQYRAAARAALAAAAAAYHASTHAAALRAAGSLILTR